MENSCDNKIEVINGCDRNDNKICSVPPVVFNSETTVVTDGDDSDDEDNEKEKALQEIIQHNNVVSPQSSTVNIESSSDVVIGPLTQFHGPVTIYQNITSDRQVCYENGNSDVTFKNAAKSTPTTETTSSPEKHKPTTIKLSVPYKRLIIYIAIFFTMLTTVLVTIAVSLNVTSNNSVIDTNDVTSLNRDELGKIPNNSVFDTNDVTLLSRDEDEKKVGKHYVFSRTKWGSRVSSNSTIPLHHPTEYVIILHTAGRICKNFLECSEVMQQTQAKFVSEQLPDIAHNFLIGGDGNIYVGRGWDVQNSYMNNSIAIGFTGNFVFEHLNPNMIAGLKELLQKGVELKKLDPEYKLVCHNQTFATLSPGQHVYNVISQFPHFVPGYVQI